MTSITELVSVQQLEQAYAAQSGIDQYAQQMQMLQQQIEALQSDERDFNNFKREHDYKQANRPPEPEKQSTPRYVEILGDDGSTEKWLVDESGMPSQLVGRTQPAPTAEADVSGKDMDIGEAMTVLDEADAALSDIPWHSGTGPVQGRVAGLTEWNQNFQALSDRIFAVAKRIYKTKGEGQFSDADAAALRGMLFGANRNEEVNQRIISSLRNSLQARSPSFQQFQQEVSGLVGGGMASNGGGDLEAMAQQAIAQGADPEQVRQRMQQIMQQQNPQVAGGQ